MHRKRAPTVKKSMKFEAIAALRALGETDLTPERLKEVQDPEVACLLLQAEVATVIPFGFLVRTSISRLDLSAVSTVTRIEDYFLTGCRGLTAVDLSSFTSLTHVGGCFLEGCTSLTSLDLPSLNSLTHVGHRFLQGCTSLASVDLSSSNSLTYVGDGFLHNCVSLTSLDLSSLENVTHIGLIQPPFRECANLQTIRLSGCSAVVSRAVRNANLMKFVADARPKRKRVKSPEEDCKRPRLSQ